MKKRKEQVAKSAEKSNESLIIVFVKFQSENSCNERKEV
jgi:hypothetical protein